MQRQHVESKALHSVGYDAQCRVLEIEFTSGEVYRYRRVPARVHAGLMAADSHGHDFATQIRDLFESEHVQIR